MKTKRGEGRAMMKLNLIIQRRINNDGGGRKGRTCLPVASKLAIQRLHGALYSVIGQVGQAAR